LPDHLKAKGPALPTRSGRQAGLVAKVALRTATKSPARLADLTGLFPWDGGPEEVERRLRCRKVAVLPT